MKLSPTPTQRNLLSHKVVITGEMPRRDIVVHFDYPDCTRTFDGAHWTVTAKEQPNDK